MTDANIDRNRDIERHFFRRGRYVLEDRDTAECFHVVKDDTFAADTFWAVSFKGRAIGEFETLRDATEFVRAFRG